MFKSCPKNRSQHSNKTIPLSIPNTFSVTGAGSFYAGTNEWSINSLTFKMEITDPNATLDLSDYSSFENGSTFYHDYPVQTVKKTTLPTFSWNKIPRWVAARSTVPFSDQQINDIANNYQLILLEKANSQGFTYIEDGVKNAATRLKAVNPNLTTLFYYNTFINYSDYKANIEYNQNAAAWSTYETNPTTGQQQIFLFKNLYYWYNPNIEGMRNWWIKTCVEMANHDVIDGVFIDKVVNPDNNGDAYDVNGNPVNNYTKMLKDLYQQLPANKLVIGNTLRNERAGGSRDLMNSSDGSYMERWEFPSTGQSHADAIAVSIQLMREALQKGKMINLQSGPNPSEEDPLPTNPAELLAFTKNNVYFPLAVYLIIAQENAYFSYTTGVDAKSTSGNLWDTSFIDEFHYFLGEPLGEPTKNGYIYERSFENLDLWVNIETKETVFNWKDKTLLSNESDFTVPLKTTILSPNPVRDSFTLSQEIKSATIYNMVGQKVMSYTKNKTQYDVSMLQNGEYIIKLILENGKSQTIRFIKN